MGFKIRTSSDNSTDKGCHSINWSFKKIKDIAPLQRGFDLPASQIIKGEYPVCYSNGIANYHNEYKVEGPGVFTGRSGTIGNVFYVKENFWPHNTTLWVTDFKNNDEKFIYYLYQQVKLERFNAGTGVPTLNRNDVHDYKVLVPTNKEEQQKIASILSTWDKAIELKEKLIEQKKEQKKGLMQKLLTGEVRLPGFKGEWKEVQIKDLSKVVTGNTPSTKNNDFYENGIYPWITPSDINDSKYISQSERRLTEKGLDKGRYLPKGTLLVTCIASIGKNAILTRDGSCNQQINAILPSDLHSNEFLYYKLELEVKKMERLAGKTATPIINKNTFEKYKLLIPTLDEQNAIAELLSKFDKSIELSIKELEQLKLQKKGLMQLLLTGKVRVKV